MGKLNLKYGNVLDHLEGMDAIVNSTNKYMLCGSGVCGAIYKRANKSKLEEYGKTNFKDNMEVNEIRITPGFDLGIDIIHICCPKAYESREPLKEILQSYENIFKVAKEKGYKNIASVSLGTGVNGYKHNEVAKKAVKVLSELVNKYDINFILFVYGEDNFEFYKNI